LEEDTGAFRKRERRKSGYLRTFFGGKSSRRRVYVKIKYSERPALRGGKGGKRGKVKHRRTISHAGILVY